MFHVLQSLKDGTTRLVDVPVPQVSGAALLVESRATVISAGTERMLVDFGRAGWIDKARSQPDKVMQVLEKVRTDGLGPTLDAVRAKLDVPIALGYCQAGVVVEVGSGVEGFAPGDRVVTNGPHAEYVRVGQTLAARIPDGVSFESAAFTPLAAIGLEGLRLAQPTLGETVVVYGLGLIGLLTVQLARAAGCRVIGIDRSSERCALAEQFGATAIEAGEGVDVAEAVLALTGGVGADAVLLTLATDSDEPAHMAAVMSRKRGRIVLVGVAGLKLRRDDFYRKELSFQVSCSYGPGRYDPVHEERGIDYPLPYVRWTEGRNFAAVLELMADGRVDPQPLISHRFAIADATAAYDLVGGGGAPSLGIVLSYPEKAPGTLAAGRSVVLRAGTPAAGKGIVGWIGAGSFASRVLIPAFAKAGAALDAIASSGGTSSAVVGAQQGFRRATTESESVLSDPAIDTIVVTTRHDSHARWVLAALAAGKHVFVEKPLALTHGELDEIESALGRSDALLCVGFNRRFAPHVRRAGQALRSRTGPVAISITVNAGHIPRDHWTQDARTGGGRIVGEGCHFIDLARHLAGSAIASMQVTTARLGGLAASDMSLIQLSFADGSIATVQYLANGNKGFPKERIELFFDGNVIQLDNYRTIRAWGKPVASLAARWPQSQDKGHAALAAAFVAAVKEGGEPPIPVAELLEVSRVSVDAAALARNGGGTSSYGGTVGR
jgi:predicted dehydrogenase/threonine dehydrogenase-like Zn-dependent dehydrogenase